MCRGAVKNAFHRFCTVAFGSHLSVLPWSCNLRCVSSAEGTAAILHCAYHSDLESPGMLVAAAMRRDVAIGLDFA
jgi:hypothetical protein